MVPAPIQQHPNASLATGLSGLGVLLVWAAGSVGVELGPEQAVAATGALTSLGLLIGRKGVRGLIRWLWRGNEVV